MVTAIRDPHPVYLFAGLYSGSVVGLVVSVCVICLVSAVAGSSSCPYLELVLLAATIKGQIPWHVCIFAEYGWEIIC